MPDSYERRPSDPPMTSEEEAIAASLSPSMIESIDRALLSHAKARGRKVAMLVALAMSDPALRVSGLPDLFYARRVKVLVDKGALVADGEFTSMGRSEVRLP